MPTNAKPYRGLTDLKSRVDLTAPPADWVMDLYHDDRPALPGAVVTALVGVLQVAAGMGLGWLIWGGA